jgi:hypothetical protein
MLPASLPSRPMMKVVGMDEMPPYAWAVREARLRGKGLHAGGPAFIERNADDHHSLIGILGMQRDEVGDFSPAWRTPGGPEVEHDDFAFEVGELDRLAIKPRQNPLGCCGFAPRPAAHGDDASWLEKAATTRGTIAESPARECDADGEEEDGDFVEFHWNVMWEVY